MRVGVVMEALIMILAVSLYQKATLMLGLIASLIEFGVILAVRRLIVAKETRLATMCIVSCIVFAYFCIIKRASLPMVGSISLALSIFAFGPRPMAGPR